MDHPVCAGMQSTAESINMHACVHPHPCTSCMGLKTHKCTHSLQYTCTVHAGTQIDRQNTSAHIHAGIEEWQWSVSPVIIVLEDERSEAEKGVEECWRGDRGGGREEKKNARVINMHKAWLLSFCWKNKTLLIAAVRSPTTTACFLFCFVFFFSLYWFVLQFFILVSEETIILNVFFFIICLFQFKTTFLTRLMG